MLARSLWLLVFLLAPGMALAQAVWTMATEYPASAIPGQGVSTFARLVREKTGGQLSIEPSFDAASGIKSAGMLDAVGSGRLQAGDAFAGALGGKDPIFALSSLPFLVASVEDAHRLADLSRPALQATLSRLGQRLLYVTPWPPSGLWSKNAVIDLDSLRQLTIRTYDDTSTRVLAAVGAKAVNVSFADTMPKLKDGSIDAVLSSGDGGAGRRLWEFLPHFTELNYALPLSVASASEAAYSALPEEVRRALDEAALDTERAQWRAVQTRLGENYDRMRQNDVAIATAPDPSMMSELRRAAAPAIAEWEKSAAPEIAAILERFRQGESR